MSKRGNVFIILVAILGVIFTTATFFMQATIEEKGQTEVSLRTVQTQCLAEAALERAMGILARDLNDPEKFKEKDSIAAKMRVPMGVSATMGPSAPSKPGAGLGKDDPLVVPDDYRELVVLQNLELQPPDAKGGKQNDLDKLVEFMVGSAKGTEYHVIVKVGMQSAFRTAPGPTVENAPYQYLIPGVDIPWSIHPLIKGFLENKGFVALRFRFPDGWKWFNFSIPITVAGITVWEVDLVEILEKVWPDAKTFTQYFEVHTLFAKLFPSFYPYDIVFAKDVFPQVAEKFPGWTPPALDPKKPAEKYGYLSLESEATITYPDGRSTTRTVAATKEFKCADIQPVAPMYSFFVSNLADDILNLNDVGGNLYINNFAAFSAVKNGPGADNKEKYEFPGQIRINGNSPVACNVSFIGNPAAPNLDDPLNDGVFSKVGRGMEVLMMLDMFCRMEGIGGTSLDGSPRTDLVSYVPKKYQDKYSDKLNTSVSWAQHTVSPFEGGKKVGATVSGPNNNVTTLGVNTAPKPSAGGSVAAGSSESFKDQLVGKLKDGLIPNMPSLNVMPPFSFGISLLGIPMHLIEMLDPWSKWEWPFMGFGYRLFRLPDTGVGQNVSHLFGSGALFPPLSRDIEGFVLKRYRQWNMGVVGWPLGPFPLGGNQIITPWGPMPPIPIPLWHTHDIVNKYDYNLWLLKAPKDEAGSSGDEDVTTYDPTIKENSPPNLYSVEQYAKKAAYYYSSQDDFYRDLPNRMIKVNNKSALRLNGITFISDSLTIPPPGSGTLVVTGKGAIVVGGNIILTGSIEDPYSAEEERKKETPRTVFSLIARQGGMIYDSNNSPNWAKIEGSVYTEKGIAVPKGKALKIFGNWVTNKFNKGYSNGEIMVEYTGYKTRASLFSLHPDYGKYDSERYFISIAPTWDTWKVK